MANSDRSARADIAGEAAFETGEILDAIKGLEATTEPNERERVTRTLLRRLATLNTIQMDVIFNPTQNGAGATKTDELRQMYEAA